MIEVFLLLAAAGIGLGAGFVIGTRDAHRKLRLQVDDLEARVAAYSAEAEKDPTRAALDQGQYYVLNMLENFIAQVRAHIDDRRERDSRPRMN